MCTVIGQADSVAKLFCGLLPSALTFVASKSLKLLEISFTLNCVLTISN